MASVLVTGSAGMLGSALLPRLIARGHEVRVLVHSKPPADGLAVTAVHGDVVTGAGLLDAVAGVDAVVHAATSPLRHAKAVEVEGTRRMADAAQTVGAHFIYPSIVGVDRMGGTYYRAKDTAEQMVSSGSNWTIQRMTQFHPFIDRLLGLPVFPNSRHLAFQPVDVDEASDCLVDLVEAGPSGRAEDFGGPEVLTLRELAVARRSTTGRRARLIRVPAIGPLRALDDGLILCRDHARGRVAWQSWLDAHRHAVDA